MRMQLHLAEARSEHEFEPAIRAIDEGKPPALLVLADPVYVTHARRIAERALKHRLAAVSGNRFLAEQGVLMTYGPSFRDAYERAAVYVDRISRAPGPRIFRSNARPASN
jgi:putative tryptophan/tyrosine transport system substrate-binding protein